MASGDLIFFWGDGFLGVGFRGLGLRGQRFNIIGIRWTVNIPGSAVGLRGQGFRGLSGG